MNFKFVQDCYDHVSVKCSLHIIIDVSNMVDLANQYKVEEVDKEYVHSIDILMKLPEWRNYWTKLEIWTAFCFYRTILMKL